MCPTVLSRDRLNPEFERTYSEYRGLMLALANRILQDPALAEDAVQETFMHLLSLLGSPGPAAQAEAGANPAPGGPAGAGEPRAGPGSASGGPGGPGPAAGGAAHGGAAGSDLRPYGKAGVGNLGLQPRQGGEADQPGQGKAAEAAAGGGIDETEANA